MAVLAKLDKKFIETLVHEPVQSFSIKTGSKKGDNVAGDIYAINVITVSSKILNLVYKVFPEDNVMLAEFARLNGIFDIEITMYTTIAEKMSALLHMAGLTGEDAELPFPKYFNGLCDGVNDYLALEDERPNGYMMPNKHVGLNFDEVSLIMKELARFHAITYHLIKYEGEQVFEKTTTGLKRYINGFWNDLKNPATSAMTQGMFGTAYDIAVKQIETRIDGELAGKVRAGINQNDAGKIVRQTAALTDTKIFPVIAHGDFWTNNILLKYDENGKPIALKFIDFQQSRRGNIYDDLLYFIFASTTPEFRPKYLAQVLDVYYDSFTSTITKLKCPVPQNFSRGSFFDLFYDGYKSIYIYMLYAIPLQLGKHSSESDVEVEGDEKPGPVDIQVAMAKWFEKIDKLYSETPAALERLEKLTREMIKFNVF